jgi:acetyl esterase
MAANEDVSQLDPALQQAYTSFGAVVVRPDTLDTYRGAPLFAPPPVPPGVSKLSVDEPSGVKGSLYIPADAQNPGQRPALLWFHGGGYVFGTPEATQRTAQTIAAGTGLVVFCPVYRLAPEHPYPAAVEDAIKALQWLSAKKDNNSSEALRNVDTKRIAAGGVSAGRSQPLRI